MAPCPRRVRVLLADDTIIWHGKRLLDDGNVGVPLHALLGVAKLERSRLAIPHLVALLVEPCVATGGLAPWLHPLVVFGVKLVVMLLRPCPASTSEGEREHEDREDCRTDEVVGAHGSRYP